MSILEHRIQHQRLLQTVTVIKPGYFLLAAGVSCLICINALRTNNLEMIRLRSEVYVADQQNKDVQTKLTNLQHFVTSHMNTDLTPKNDSVHPPIQLQYTYERLQAEQVNSHSNEQVYNDAQKHCESLNSSDFSGRNRVPCIQEYVSTHGAAETKTIPDSLYKYDFLSPSWSPDLAGWSMVSTIGLTLFAIVLWIVRRKIAPRR